MMSFKKLVKGGLAALMALSLAACEASEGSSGKSTSTETTSDYVAAGDLKSYTIGTLGPTTGDYAVYGLAVTNAVKLAVEDYNAAKGTNIKVDVQDSQGDQTQALNIYNKFVSDTKVAGIIVVLFQVNLMRLQYRVRILVFLSLHLVVLLPILRMKVDQMYSVHVIQIHSKQSR